MSNNNGKLFERIGAVTARLAGKLAPDKTNQQQRYDYLSADLILQEVGRAMADVGLSIVPSVVNEDLNSVPWKTGERYDATVWFRMDVCDIDGNAFEASWTGRGSDYSVPDKALYKAITSGHKYFLMKLFNIGAGNEDSEHEAPPPARQQPTPAARQQRQDAPQAPPAPDNGQSHLDAVNDDLFSEQPPKQTDAIPTKKPTPKMVAKFHALGTECYGDEWDDKRPEITRAVSKGRCTSSTYLTQDEMSKLIDGMEAKKAEAAS